jgi:ferredoxin
MSSRFSVVIEPHGWKFEASDSAPLLQSAERAAYRLPSSCRNGTCRTCMCRMTSGKIRYDIEWPGLLAEEKREGFILPCVAYPESDVVIEVRGAVSLK